MCVHHQPFNQGHGFPSPSKYISWKNFTQKRYKFPHLGRISIALTHFPARVESLWVALKAKLCFHQSNTMPAENLSQKFVIKNVSQKSCHKMLWVDLKAKLRFHM